MSDLQIILIALGVAIILLVVLFNWWQERKFRKETAARFQPPQRDPLMEEFRIDTDALLKDEPSGIKFTTIEDRYTASERDEQTVETPHIAAQEDDLSWPATSDKVLYAAENTSDLPDETDQYPAEPPVADVGDHTIAQPAETVPSPTAENTQLLHLTMDNHASLPPAVHDQIDLVALLYLPQSTPGSGLRPFLLGLADLDKPIQAYGLRFDGSWHMLTQEKESTEFTQAACCLQLADRAGPVSSESLNRFVEAVETIAEQLSAQIKWQSSVDPLIYASELDQFCIDVDKMVGFHLIHGANGPFTGTKFRGLSEAGGLVLGEDGAFHYENDSTQRLFSVMNQGNAPFSMDMLRNTAIRGVTFQLDIPRVKNCAEAFNHMVLLARQMEISLNASLIDDKHRPLGEMQIEKIRQQLKTIHSTMVARGIIPGSAAALRLFS